MGTPKKAGVLVMGTNFPALDATCARVMGINPYKIRYLKLAHGRCGTIAEKAIEQRGETISSVKTDFALAPYVPAHKNIRG
jgi:uncharacterized protein (DUF362 family)